MATTYYMALFLDTLLQLYRYELILDSNASRGFTPESNIEFPKLDVPMEPNDETPYVCYNSWDKDFVVHDPLQVVSSVVTIPKITEPRSSEVVKMQEPEEEAKRAD